MTETGFVFGSPEWLIPAAVAVGLAALFVIWSYSRSRGPRAVVFACAVLKIVAVTALGLCLLEPLLTGSRPQPGANVFVVLADTSRSLQIRGGDSGGPSRADWARSLLENNPAWRTRLGQDFDVRNFVFDTHLRGVDGFDGLTFDGNATSLHTALAAVAKRYQGRPVAGVLLVSDGNATDAAALDWSSLPPVYPVLPPAGGVPRDIAVSRLTVNQTNFEAAPVTLQAEAMALGVKGEAVVAILSNEAGREIDRQEATVADDREPLNFRFQVRPEKAGVGFYRVQVRLKSEVANAADAPSIEQTLANNGRLVAVDRGRGPHRVLYVCGRPNWEFKYLRRAMEDDAEVQLVGLVRVARREPKFDFRSARTRPDNPLFKGFDNPDAETAERHDQPVMIRLGTQDAVELRTGFPQAAADLYRYDAVILDDIEAEFFTPDQQALLRNFVSRRGGGFLMLGGPDSFSAGKYDRTPVGELLPVYLDRPAAAAGAEDFRLVLTREGWLQPWVRTRKTEDDENRRLAAMAPFHTLNRVGRAKPGATVLAQVRDPAGTELPALVAQPFGKGRSAALLIGDLWRWGLRRDDPKQDDFDRSWRQTVRWLVADVPGRVEVRATPTAGAALPAMELAVQSTDAEYVPLDNAAVSVQITRPNGETLTLPAEADRREAGQYLATFVPREPGAYRATATVTAPDGSTVGKREVGWCVQPEADEFARLEPNRELLEQIATRTQGEVVPADGLERFVANLPSRKAPNMEAWATPLWHRGWYFAVTLLCLAAEWGLRRRFGMA
ncbi:glutamine amidotransferase [Limnoglobus roseus]|uniref:VWA domain-containing protein n=1 Tax=Limnoglobus roseus TaxID=2598579 RepID=A0A5C1APH7_9BACT|nr:glutamine amidotransferase [Limnoglobus roseus]QEL19652.1 VWA domain-containing protein [Limnoglobus roseus]